MSLVRLNLSALRQKRQFAAESDPLSALAHVDEGGFRISRRQVLKSAGLAAAALTPLALSAKGAVPPLLRGAFALKEDGDALHFMLGKKICWTIDPARFSGNPILTYDRSEDHLLVRLRDAYYPGTKIPADLTLLIRTRLTDCSIKLTMAFGGFSAVGSLENWLACEGPLKSALRLDHHVHTSNSETSLYLNGSCRAKFFPDWRLQLNGESVATLHGFGEPLRANEATISLAKEGSSSLLSGHEEGNPRALFTLEKGNHRWAIKHGVDAEKHWSLGLKDDTLDRISIEAMDHPTGAIHAILAEQLTQSRSADFTLHSVKAINGESFRLPLAGAKLAILYAKSGEERALTAQYHSEPAWLHTNGCSLLIGAPDLQSNEPSAPFEVYARNGILEHLHCEPALLRIAAPLAGAIVDAADVPTGTRLAITTTLELGERERENPFIATLALNDNGDENALLRFPANFIIGVVRPDDLLVLKFEFFNMEFKSEGKEGMRLIKKTGKGVGAPYFVVHFPPQNIAEQAFFLTTDVPFTPPDAASLKLPPNSSYKPDTSGNETPAPPAVRARIAGPSRLAFYVPPEVDSIAYTLKALLDWTKLQPSLVPVALPPPPPPWTIYYLPVGSFNQTKLISRDVGSNFKYNGSKVSRAQMNVQLANTAQKPVPQILTDVRHSPKFTVSTNESFKQQAISNIRQNNKSSFSSDYISLLGDLIAQDVPGSKLSFPPEVFLDFTIRPPHLYETALETPYRLIMSPNQYGGWAHRPDLVTETDAKGIVWTELWHTRLGVKRVDSDKKVTIDEQDDYYRTLRAVWSPDYNANDGPDLALNPKHYPAGDPFFRMSLDRRDRHELVELTSGFAIPNLPDTDKRIIRADRLMLSSQGAWMNTRGAWDVPFVEAKPLSVEEWRHRSTMGRDHYVRVVYKGFLFPFGHCASLIKITERRFEWQKGGGYNIAYLRQRMFIVVRQPLKQYPADFQPNGGRKLPFQSVEITTLVTPNIKPPNTEAIDSANPQTAFWPHIPADDPGQSFRFHCIGTDWEGRRIEFVAPLAFIDNTRAYTFGASSAIDLAVSKYKTDTAKSQIAFSGQKIAYADARKAGDTTFETTTITFGAEKPDPSVTPTQLGTHDQPGFYPTMEQADLHIEAVKQIAAVGGPSPMKYHTSFVQKAWDGLHNPGEVFLQVIGLPIGLGFGGSGGVSTDKVGGLVTPSMAISGLSRLTGPLSGNIDVPESLPDPTTLPAALKGVFDPKDFFSKLDPDSIKLLGGLSLMDILKLVGTAAADATGLKDALESQLKELVNDAKDAAKQITTDVIDKLPKSPMPAYISQMIYDAEAAASQVQNALKIPKQIQILFKWNPSVQEFGPFKLNEGAKAEEILSLAAMLVIPINAPVIPTPDPAKGMPDPATFQAPSLGTPVYTVLAKLQNFTLDLFGVIAIKFKSVSFKMETGKKADINADIDDVSFEGPLAFVNDLEKVIPSDGFSDPPSIEVTPTGVTIGFDLALPTISVGAFSLSHVALGASLNLPFTGAPLRFRFHFCTRENPFLLTIYCFGGGGFFAIELGLDGLELLEASFEFGAAVALDFGIASGSVSIMAGIYFKLTKTSTGDECLITGYVRVNGNLDVCGIISVSIELYLAISYDSGPPKKCWGEATLTIKVSILFFSIGFSTSMRKEFVDPALQLKDYMVADDWAAYHLAFADNFQVQQ